MPHGVIAKIIQQVFMGLMQGSHGLLHIQRSEIDSKRLYLGNGINKAAVIVAVIDDQVIFICYSIPAFLHIIKFLSIKGALDGKRSPVFSIRYLPAVCADNDVGFPELPVVG